MSKPVPLYKPGEPHTVYSLLTELEEKMDEIEEIYVAVKSKDGIFDEVLCGDLAGLNMAILILQKTAMDNL